MSSCLRGNADWYVHTKKMVFMKLAILAPGVFPSMAEARAKLWIFMASAKDRIPPEHLYIYGGGTAQFPGYRRMLLEQTLPELIGLDNAGYSHVLFTDAWDGMFLGTYEEICDCYDEMGQPSILLSASHQLGNVSDEHKQYPGVFEDNGGKYRFPNRGGYIGEIERLIECYQIMQRYETGDDCFCWYNLKRDFPHAYDIDNTCDIFQVTEEDCVVSETRRVYNMETFSFPLVWHLPGGYTDPQTGKDARLIPLAKSLGIIP
jgi:hypothetical protein